jgi:hypothetical protein
MEEELTSIVGRKVDLKTPEDLSSYFRDEVLAQAKILYGKQGFDLAQIVSISA